VGKWHLGVLPTYGPLQSGYDHFYGFRGSAVDYYSHAGTDQTDDLWDDDVAIRLPSPQDVSPVVKALMRGDYFVTSGEVLIPSYSVRGSGGQRTIEADVEWTFPLEFSKWSGVMA